MSESRHVGYISKNNEFERKIASSSQKYPIDEKMYSEELFKMGREEAFLDMGKITKEQRLHLETNYPGDIKNSVNYLRGYKRGIELSLSSILPPEYLEENKLHR